MQDHVRCRWADPQDFEALGAVMYAAIHAEPSPYTKAQRLAWCPTPPSGPGWQARLASQHVAVVETGAVVKTGQPAGMLTLRSDGHLDLAFIRPEARGHGHLRALMTMICNRAQDMGLTQITTHASLSAQAPFSALGFEVVQHEAVEYDGQTLRRAEMVLDLKKAGPSGLMR